MWSQTHWSWLEIKLSELGMLTHPRYRICFCLEKSCMFRVTAPHPRKPTETCAHHVKPLALVWRNAAVAGRWHARNTLHVDDLARNFALNPRNGVKVRAFHRDKQRARGAGGADDEELPALARYLNAVAIEEAARDGGGSDVTRRDHSAWRDAGK